MFICCKGKGTTSENKGLTRKIISCRLSEIPKRATGMRELCKGVSQIRLSIIDRVSSIVLSLKGAMIPTEIILSPSTYEEIISELNISDGNTDHDARLMLERHFAMSISIREENSDVITAKELYPDRCPICGRCIPFVREMIDRLESRATNKIRCPLGHRYEGQIKVYYLNVFQPEQNRQESKTIETCPQCESTSIQYLGPSEAFCLDSAWDSDMLARF